MDTESKPGAQMKWEELLNARELNEVHLAHTYATAFAHGTTGHNQLMLIHKLASYLDQLEFAEVDVNTLVTVNVDTSQV